MIVRLIYIFFIIFSYEIFADNKEILPVVKKIILLDSYDLTELKSLVRNIKLEEEKSFYNSEKTKKELEQEQKEFDKYGNIYNFQRPSLPFEEVQKDRYQKALIQSFSKKIIEKKLN